jgi:hypothetical protein
MGLDALLPPPLSRAHQKAQADEARALADEVDLFLDMLDAEFPLRSPGRSGLRPGPAAID